MMNKRPLVMGMMYQLLGILYLVFANRNEWYIIGIIWIILGAISLVWAGE